MGGGWLLDGMYLEILGHFTHGKAHVSIEFVPYLYRKAMMFYTDIWSVHFFDASDQDEDTCTNRPCLIARQVGRSKTNKGLATRLTSS